MYEIRHHIQGQDYGSLTYIRCLILRVLKESLREDGKDILIAQKENMGV